MASFPLEFWIPPAAKDITYTCDEAIEAKSAMLNSYNVLLNNAIDVGDAKLIALYKQLIKQTRVDISDLGTLKKCQVSHAK